jgi:hypothetical protein
VRLTLEENRSDSAQMLGERVASALDRILMLFGLMVRRLERLASSKGRVAALKETLDAPGCDERMEPRSDSSPKLSTAAVQVVSAYPESTREDTLHPKHPGERVTGFSGNSRSA